MTAAIGIHDLGGQNGAVLHFVNLELLGVTEVLEDHTVSVGNCDTHNVFAPLVWYTLYYSLFFLSVKFPAKVPAGSFADTRYLPCCRRSGRRFPTRYL